MRFRSSKTHVSADVDVNHVPIGCGLAACWLSIFGLMVGFAAVALFSGSALITPINAVVQRVVMGATVALVILAWVLWALSARRARRNAPLVVRWQRSNFSKGKAWLRGCWRAVKYTVAFVASVLFALITSFNAVKDYANLWAFLGSSAPWEDAVYPAEIGNRGGRSIFSRATVTIDPFRTRDPIDIPIPSSQFKQLSRMPENTLCIRVRQRRANNGAIQIATNGQTTWFEPDPVTIAPCA